MPIFGKIAQGGRIIFSISVKLLKFNYNGYFFTIYGPNKEYCYQIMDSILD